MSGFTYGKRSISFVIENKKIAHEFGYVKVSVNGVNYFSTRCDLLLHPDQERYDMEYYPKGARDRNALARDLLPPSIIPCPECF